MLTKFHYITNLKKWLQIGFRTFYRASESSPFNRSPWPGLELVVVKWIFYITNHAKRTGAWGGQTYSFSNHSNQAKIDFLHSKSFQSGQKRLPPFWAIPFGSKSTFSNGIPGRPKPTFSIPNYSIPVKPKPTSSTPSYSIQSGLNWLLPFRAIQVCPKPTSSFPRHSSQAKTDFLHFKIFQSSQNRLRPFQVIPLRSKPTLLHSKPFQTGQNCLPLFHAITVRSKLTSSIPSYSSQDNIVNKFTVLSLPCRSWSPNYSVFV
jgi:hypothetical protein